MRQKLGTHAGPARSVATCTGNSRLPGLVYWVNVTILVENLVLLSPYAR